MKEDGPFRGGPKPERVEAFHNEEYNCITNPKPKSCVVLANKWLEEHAGTVDIILREVASDEYGRFKSILVWYREKE